MKIVPCSPLPTIDYFIFVGALAICLGGCGTTSVDQRTQISNKLVPLTRPEEFPWRRLECEKPFSFTFSEASPVGRFGQERSYFLSVELPPERINAISIRSYYYGQAGDQRASFVQPEFIFLDKQLDTLAVVVPRMVSVGASWVTDAHKEGLVKVPGGARRLVVRTTLRDFLPDPTNPRQMVASSENADIEQQIAAKAASYKSLLGNLDIRCLSDTQ